MSRRTSTAGLGPKMPLEYATKRDRQSGFRLSNRHAGLQPADDPQPRCARAVQQVAPWNNLCPHRQRHPQIGRRANLFAEEAGWTRRRRWSMGTPRTRTTRPMTADLAPDAAANTRSSRRRSPAHRPAAHRRRRRRDPSLRRHRASRNTTPTPATRASFPAMPPSIVVSSSSIEALARTSENRSVSWRKA